MKFNKNSTRNNLKPVVWNNTVYPSGEELRRTLGLSSSGSVSAAIKRGSRLKGHYVDYAII